MATQTPHDPSTASGAGVTSSLSRLKRDGGHSLTELQQFLAQMRGRSPQEVLGMVSASGLVRGIVTATIGCVVLLAILTIGPYLLSDGESAAQATSESAPATTPVGDEPTSSGATAAIPPSPATGQPAGADLDAAAKALDIDEVKTADPNVNPLDTDLDKLLDGE